MKLACFSKNRSHLSDERVSSMLEALRAGGCEIVVISGREDLPGDVDVLLSIGGDGTFLAASSIVSGSGIPLLGVNTGRLGFLSENRPEDVAAPLLQGAYTLEYRTMLDVCCDGEHYTALNEVSVSRVGMSMLGIDVELDSQQLPTYWADGLLVSTSSGSTAYSLSAGGPICSPQARVLIIAPVAPHNLNVRPLVVPETSRIRIGFHSRDRRIAFATDNSDRLVGSGSTISITAAGERLGILTLHKSNFINALRTKLFWGEDVRNSNMDSDE